MRRYFTPRAIGMHATLLVLLPVFTWLTWWQFHRAIDGNTLSWAYTFEWPLFGGYAIYVWWQLIHDEPSALTRNRTGTPVSDGTSPAPHEQPGWALGGTRAGRRQERAASSTEGRLAAGPGVHPGTPGGEPADAEDDELAAYNRYLADLDAGPPNRRW